MRIAVVAIGYNRASSMKRLLNSLEHAEYSNAQVDLIISLDRSPIWESMKEMADQFEWTHGNKRVRLFVERQGLKKHVLACGDLTEEYDAVVALEDDIIVSEYYYQYVEQCIMAYDSNPNIVGISLYAPHVNPYCMRTFEPKRDGNDVYFMQVAQSWGQCWTKRMWQGFRRWYESNNGKLVPDGRLPVEVCSWDEKSWLKYYMQYTVTENAYFVYPYISLSTNSSEVGEHASVASGRLMVDLLGGRIESYRLPELNKGIRYDAYYERQFDHPILSDLKGNKLLDFYGLRYDYQDADYLVSLKQLPYKVEKSLALVMRPQEECCVHPVEGNSVYVYNLHEQGGSNARDNKCDMTFYNGYGIHWKDMLRAGCSGLCESLMRHIRRICRKK